MSGEHIEARTPAGAVVTHCPRVPVGRSLWFACCTLLIIQAVRAEPEAGADPAAVADEQELTASSPEPDEPEQDRESKAARTEMGTNENPDAVRRVRQYEDERNEGGADPADRPTAKLEAYGSVRLHAIGVYDFEDETTDRSIGDGASRFGASGEWRISKGWDVFGRAEFGFDILDTFTPKAQNDGDEKLVPRLLNVGLESEYLYLKLGKSWSTWYTVAGVADRFAVFGGNAAGVYNAGTDGGASGTGRADDAVQTLVYVDPSSWVALKPFNINLQYQTRQPIPRVRGEDYRYSVSASAWLELEKDVGIGIAHHQAQVENLDSAAVIEAGIDGNARATALAFKTYGPRWLASLVFSDLQNIETTDQFKYINARGAELFAQWEFVDRFWLVGGGNWLIPDDDDPDAGDFDVKYGVLGLRYTIDGFNRMIYAEWRDDYGELADGRSRKNEFTVGFRWDFGY